MLCIEGSFACYEVGVSFLESTCQMAESAEQSWAIFDMFELGRRDELRQKTNN